MVGVTRRPLSHGTVSGRASRCSTISPHRRGTLEARIAERAGAIGEANGWLEVERANRRTAEDILWHTQNWRRSG
jgi:hypothetical protein